MKSTWRRVAALLALSALAACAQPSAQERIDAQERAGMAPLKQHFPAAVMGFDFKGTTAIVSIDVNGYISTPDDDVDRMHAEAKSLWRSAWMAAHPNEHAQLTVRFIDFKGQTWTAERIGA